MSNQDAPPDYRAVPRPQNKTPTDYTHRERRAELVRLMRGAGDPNLGQSQYQLADRYGVSQPTISKDFTRIRESMRHHLGDDITLKADLVFDNAIEELQDQGEYYKAAQLMVKWLDWLADFGHLEREPDRAEVEHSGQVDSDVDVAHTAPDGKVTVGLPEENREQFDELIEAAERETAATRVDENGDDLSADDLGLTDESGGGE